MKILVAGCSFCLELEPILQEKFPNSRITNLSHAAAGNKFIADSVVAATVRDNFDLIYVSWSGLSRYDLVVNDPSYFDDWMAKGNLYNKDYVFTGGIGSWDHLEHTYADMIFKGIHKFMDHEQLHYLSLLEMLKIQNYLKSLNIPHYFSAIVNYFNKTPIDQIEHKAGELNAYSFANNQKLIAGLEFSNWIFDNHQGEFESCYNKNLISDDGFHPTFEGYSYWMDLLIERCKQDKII
jgi:hypothetical protein